MYSEYLRISASSWYVKGASSNYLKTDNFLSLAGRPPHYPIWGNTRNRCVTKHQSLPHSCFINIELSASNSWVFLFGKRDSLPLTSTRNWNYHHYLSSLPYLPLLKLVCPITWRCCTNLCYPSYWSVAYSNQSAIMRYDGGRDESTIRILGRRSGSSSYRRNSLKTNSRRNWMLEFVSQNRRKEEN